MEESTSTLDEFYDAVEKLKNASTEAEVEYKVVMLLQLSDFDFYPLGIVTENAGAGFIVKEMQSTISPSNILDFLPAILSLMK